MIDIGYKWKTLEIVGVDKAQRNNKYYLVTCSVCSLDTELFPSPFWFMSKWYISKGVAPCGCSKGHNWSEHEATVLLNRAIKDKVNISFNGFVDGQYKGVESNVVMECKEHGEWNSSKMSNMIRLNTGCPSCAGNFPKDHVGLTIGTCTVLEYTRRPNGGNKSYNVFCSTCATDPELFGDAIFESSIGNFMVGKVCCGCNPVRKWTDHEYKVLVSRAFKGHPFSLKGIIRVNKKATQGVFTCELHGDWQNSLNNVINGSQKCPACSVAMQDYAYVNMVEGTPALKFGIAKDPAVRLTKLSKESPHNILPLYVFKFPTVGECKAAERQCKNTLECSVLSKADMPDGWTETTWSYNLDKIIEIFKKFGGIEVKDYYVKMQML